MRQRAVLALLLVVAPATGHATTISPVVRGVGAGSDKAAGFIGYFVRFFLTEDGRYDVIDVNAGLGSADIDQALKAFGDADGLVQKAMTAYETLELDPAADYLVSALAKYEKNAANLIDVKEVASALMLLGAVHILRGEEKTGNEKLSQAVALYPSVEPDPRVFNPSMRQQFQRTHAQVLAAPKGTLSVASSPSYAELYVDGVFRGITPMAAQHLPPGRHYVRLTKDGYKSWGDVVNVAANREVTHNGVLKPVKRFDEYDRTAAAVFTEMRAKASSPDDSVEGSSAKLQRMLGADHLFAVEVKLDGDHVKLKAAQLDLRAQKRIKVAAHSFSYDARQEVFEREIGTLLRTQFGETTLGRKIDPREPRDPPKVVRAGAVGWGGDDDDERRSIGDDAGTRFGGTCFGMSCGTFKTTALVSGVAGGVVLGGVGGLMYLFAYHDHAEYRDSVQKSPQADALRSSGKLKALVGDIMVPLGVIAAAVGTGLYLFYEPPAGSGAMSRVDVSLGVGGGRAAVSAGLRF